MEGYWYIFPVKENVREGHLSGFIVGLMFAILFKTAIAQPEQFEWEQQIIIPPMTHFKTV